MRYLIRYTVLIFNAIGRRLEWPEPQANRPRNPHLAECSLVRELLGYMGMLSVTTPALLHQIKGEHIMFLTLAIVGTYVAGIYLIRLVWWQE